MQKYILFFPPGTKVFISRASKTAMIDTSSTVCVVFITHSTLAACGHWVADPHRTTFDVFYFVGPVPIADVLFGLACSREVDWILPTEQWPTVICGQTLLPYRKMIKG